MTIYQDEERATNLIWRYEDEPLDLLVALILTGLLLGVCVFWVVVWQVLT